MFRPLSPKEEQFAVCVAHGRMSYADAYRASYNVPGGYKFEGSGHLCYRIAHDPAVQNRMAELRAETRQKYAITRDQALEFWLARATYDPTALSRVIQGNCRFCNGDGHLYEWTERQYFEAVREAEANKAPLPDYGGGFGFSPTHAPHPDCPECGGVGLTIVVFADTRELSAHDLAGYESASVTAQGIKIETADRAEAWREVCKLSGLTVDQIKVGIDIPDEETLKSLTAVEAALVYKRVMGTAH